MTLSTKKTIIGFSGITTASYYFWLSNSLLINYTHFLIQTFFLFILSLSLLGTFFIFIDSKISNNFIKSFLSILVVTWITVISIKTLFYLANTTTLPDLINSFLDFERLNNNLLLKRLIIFFIPYASIFLLIIFFKKFIFKIILFISFLGIVFILLINFEIFSEILFKKKIEKITKVPENLQSNYSNRKVIWIIFDEFDPQIAFDKENILMMRNFKNTKESGIFFPNFYSTAKNTLYTMTSTLIGKPINNLSINKRVIFIDDGASKTPFVYKNTLFKDLKDNGFSFKILSSVFPYCYHLKLKKDECISIGMSEYGKFSDKFYAGALHVFSPLKKIDRFFELDNISKSKNERETVTIIDAKNIKNLKPKITESHLEKFDDGIVTFNDFNETLSSNINLVFLHIFLPHTGKEGDDYSKKIFGIKTSDDFSQYLLNLKSADIILGKILNNIEDKVNGKALIILNSDHWYRDKDITTSNVYPSLLVLKINEENQYFENQKKFSSISINKIIKEFLNENVGSHDEINKLLLNETFFEPYSYIGRFK